MRLIPATEKGHRENDKIFQSVKNCASRTSVQTTTQYLLGIKPNLISVGGGWLEPKTLYN
jgi:hypothetical protein